MTTRNTLALGDRRVSYLEAGAGASLVLLHAFPLAAEMWGPQLQSPPPGWRVVAPDLRGFGESAAGTPARTLDDYADDVEALLSRLGLERAVIGGLSMGGYVTFALFRRRPDLFQGVVLADTRPQADTDEGRANRRKMQDLVRREGSRAVADQMLPTLLAGVEPGADPASPGGSSGSSSRRGPTRSMRRSMR
jgi:pimeloyl-ACP methyl ester carboxylesterase